MGSTMSDLLVVEGLTRTFRGRGFKGRRIRVNAVDNISFHVARGETLALVGESGSGKSTTGMLVLRLLKPNSGRVAFDGLDLGTLRRAALRRWRRRAQMIFQDPFGSFDPHMTIGQSLTEPLRIHRVGDRAEQQSIVVSLLDRIGLDEQVLDRYPYEFSGGQLQRLAVARAIAPGPDLVVCDEPVAALDMSIQAQVLNLLRDLQRQWGFSMIFISHDLSLVRVVAHRTAVMYQGRIVEVGSTEAIYERPAHPYTQALLSAVPLPRPRTQRTRKRVELPLVAPSLTGCAFVTRCAHALPRCHSERPEPAPTEDGRLVACHLEPSRSSVS